MNARAFLGTILGACAAAFVVVGSTPLPAGAAGLLLAYNRIFRRHRRWWRRTFRRRRRYWNHYFRRHRRRWRRRFRR